MAVLAAVIIGAWSGGCQEEQASSAGSTPAKDVQGQASSSQDVKLHRLIAMENRELGAKLQVETKKRDDEIKNLKTQLQTETQKRDNDINNLKGRLQTETKRRDDEIKSLKTQLQAETQKRDDEIKNLKSQIQNETQKRDDEIKNLKGQLAQCTRERDAGVKTLKEQYLRVLANIMEKNSELTAEVSRLQTEAEKTRK